MTASAKKYKLFSTAGSSATGSERPPCAFFASPSGCRNGDGCKFAHHEGATSPVVVDYASMAAAPTHRKSSPGSVVSSESSSGEVFEAKGGRPHSTLATVTATTTTAAAEPASTSRNISDSQDPASANKKKRKKRRNKKEGDNNDNPFANPKNKKAKASPEPTKDKDQSTITTKIQEQVAAEPQGPKVSPPATTASTPPTAGAGFRALNLPIAPFSLPGTTVQARNEELTHLDGKATATAPPLQAATLAPAPYYPLPSRTEAGRKWRGLVEQTRRHARFQIMYDLPKFQSFDEEIGYGKSLWIKPKPFGDWCKDCPPVIALDCEMCETQDPVSGCKDPRALCRISIIDAEKGELLLDSLVKPNWPVVNHRTFVNGIAEEHLENVKFTLRHAQAFLLALCSEETVILGHALQNDLAAMKMEHYCVVDSACLFEAKDNPDAIVSLKDLAGTILKRVMPEQHDSVNDASTALACIKHYLEKQGQVEKIERTIATRPNYGTQLFIHRIPKNCEESHISQMFLSHTGVQPSEVDSIAFSGDSGKTTAHFQSTRHANLAFDTLESKAEVEASGRLQKKVYLRSGGYVRVRKMAFEKPKHQDSTKPDAVGTPVATKVIDAGPRRSEL